MKTKTSFMLILIILLLIGIGIGISTASLIEHYAILSGTVIVENCTVT